MAAGDGDLDTSAVLKEVRRRTIATDRDNPKDTQP